MLCDPRISNGLLALPFELQVAQVRYLIVVGTVCSQRM
jgi:hypothetical protein